MKKKLIGILIVFLLVGCGEKKAEDQDSSNIPIYEEAADKSSATEQNDKEEKKELKACYGTISSISESSITIDGVDSKIYTGDPSGFTKLNQGEFVYFEYISYEENDDGYNVEFTLLRKQAKNFDGVRDKKLY